MTDREKRREFERLAKELFPNRIVILNNCEGTMIEFKVEKIEGLMQQEGEPETFFARCGDLVLTEGGAEGEQRQFHRVPSEGSGTEEHQWVAPVSNSNNEADLRAQLAEVTAERDALLAEAIVSEPQVVLEARLARVTAERDLLFDEGARKGQALAEVTAERDRLDKLYVGEMKEVARLEDELADVGLYLDKLLRAVETDIMGAKRLAAKIREERS